MHVSLTRSPLRIDEAHSLVRGSGRGAVALFSGEVRGLEEGEPIAAIAYEAYEPMAVKELARLARSAEEHYGAAVAVLHRLGEVPAGEASVLVAAAATHREEAFAACREVVEGLKRHVPIWKAAFRPVTVP